MRRLSFAALSIASLGALSAACGSSESSDSNTGGNAGAGTGGNAGAGGRSQGSGGRNEGGGANEGGRGEPGGAANEGGSAGSGGGDVTTCDPDPCVFGACVDAGGSSRCECDLGWSGTLCNEPIEVVDHCSPNPCEHGACVNKNDAHVCECELGWAGESCNKEIPIVEHCEPNPCKNGVCINQNAGFLCECAFGWSGDTCETAANPCEPSPCQEGTCVVTVDGPTCQCSPGFTGPKCNQPVENHCTPNPCKHGTCESTLGGAVCHCDAGYSGQTCSKAVENPCQPNPCVNGVCQADGANAVCDCFSGYEGNHCESEIAGHPTNPVLRINDCSIELVSPSGWVDNGDGSFTSGGSIGLNLGGVVLPLSGPSVTYDSKDRSFSGSFEALPMPAIGFLAGALFGFSSSDVSTSAVLTGSQVKAALGDDSLPIPDALEVLAFSLDAPKPTLSLSGTGGLSVGVDDAVGIGFYLDPCDPLAYLHLSSVISPPIGPVQLTDFGASIDKQLAQASAVELWDGQQTKERSLSGHAYLGGSFDLEAITGIPIGIDGTLLVDVDPNRDGSIDPDVFSKFFTTGNIAEAASKTASTAADFGLLSNGVVSPSLPFVAGQLANFFSNQFGLRLDLANGSVLYDSSALYFRGISNANPFRDTPIAAFVPKNPTIDMMGYARGPLDWGLRFSSDAHFIPGGPGYAALFDLAVSENDPRLTIETQIDFGTIDFIPGVTIPLGSVPINFGVDFATGHVCGETGYTSSEFSCTIEVCVGPSAFEFNPICELPPGFVCVDDSMCISDKCSNLIPDSACAAGCDGVQATCKGACDATRATCDGTCTATEATCTGTCGVAFDTCDAGCAATDAVCNGTCDTTGKACRGPCDATETVCNTGCTAAEATCNGTCGATETTCKGACTATGEACRAPCTATEATCNAGCSVAQGVCNGACDATFATCDAGCWAGTGACSATYETCRVGCIAACHCVTICAPWPFDDECTTQCTCDRDSCINSCASTRDSCTSAIVTPCRNACASTRNSCKSGCSNGLGSCSNSCNGAGNSCRGACNTVQSGCSDGCTTAGNNCRGGCAGGLNNCKGSCRSTGNSCRGACNSAENTCKSGCATATANCGTTCDNARKDCVGPCKTAGDNCHQGCADGIADCNAPCDSTHDGCISGCEFVGTCD